MEWFGHAAAQGHAHSSYNLAIGHLKGFKTKLDPGEAHEHIKYAADQGFHLAKDVLLHVCKHGKHGICGKRGKHGKHVLVFTSAS